MGGGWAAAQEPLCPPGSRLGSVLPGSHPALPHACSPPPLQRDALVSQLAVLTATDLRQFRAALEALRPPALLPVPEGAAGEAPGTQRRPWGQAALLADTAAAHLKFMAAPGQAAVVAYRLPGPAGENGAGHGREPRRTQGRGVAWCGRGAHAV